MSPAKQRRPNPDVEEVARQQKRRAEPGAGGPARREDADARRHPSRLSENRKRLGVGPKHKTRAMKKGRRGTYP